MEVPVTSFNLIESLYFPVVRSFLDPLLQNLSHLNVFAVKEDCPRPFLAGITGISEDLDFFFSHVLEAFSHPSIPFSILRCRATREEGHQGMEVLGVYFF
jgi:hypothetical protein